MLLFLVLAALTITILAVIFAVQNVGIVLISFLLWRLEGSLALVLLLTFALGFIAGLLILLPKSLSKSFTIANQKKKLDRLQEKTVETSKPGDQGV